MSDSATLSVEHRTASKSEEREATKDPKEFDIETCILAALLRDSILREIDGTPLPYTKARYQLVRCESIWALLINDRTNRLPPAIRKRISDELRDPVSFEDRSTIQEAWKKPPAPNTQKEIRLLVLRPSERKHSGIECRLCKALFDETSPPKYDVLSYPRGDTKSRSIQVDGEDYRVTEHLESALRQLRHRKCPRVLWVDDFCVEPEDSQDRHAMVSWMKVVYERAQEVVVWLGKESNTSVKAFAFFRNFNGALTKEDENKFSCDVGVLSGLIIHPMYNASWDGVKKLLERPWWNYYAIFGEILKGSNCILQCGSDRINWKDFPALFFSALLKIRSTLNDSSVRYPAAIDQMISRMVLSLRDCGINESKDIEFEKPVTLVETLTSDICHMLRNPQPNFSLASIEDLTFSAELLTLLSVRLAGRYQRRSSMFSPSAQDDFLRDLEQKSKEPEAASLGGRRIGHIYDPAIIDGTEFLKNRPDFSSQIWEIQNAGAVSQDLVSRLEEIVEKVSEGDKDLDCWLRIIKATSSRTKRTYDLDQETTSSVVQKSNEYCYEALDLKAQEIRLLILNPSADPAADIHCDLIPVSIAPLSALKIERLPYMALSYVWGPSDPPQEIILQGKRKTVTPNLFAALKQIRDPATLSLLWVDAICIDQQSFEEKNHQVALMSAIYKKAGSVLMWLGEDDSDGTAMEFLSFLDYKPELKNDYLDRKNLKPFLKLIDHVGSSIRWTALNNLFRRPYWSRVWIMQEVVLAQDPIICCGKYSASFMVVVAFHRFVGRFPIGYGGPVDDPYEQRLVQQLAETYARQMEETPTTVLDSLLQSRERFAKVTHDYIYGALGIVNAENVSLTVDYVESFLTVSKEIFQHIVHKDRNLDILSACETFKAKDAPNDENKLVSISLRSNHGVDDKHNWPSWLPDWSYKDDYSRSSHFPMRSILFNVSGNSFKAAEESIPAVHFPDGEMLCSIEGAVYDTVGYVSTYEGHDWYSADLKQSYVKAAEEHSIYSNEAERKRAFGRLQYFGEFKTDDNEEGMLQGDTTDSSASSNRLDTIARTSDATEALQLGADERDVQKENTPTIRIPHNEKESESRKRDNVATEDFAAEEVAVSGAIERNEAENATYTAHHTPAQHEKPQRATVSSVEDPHWFLKMVYYSSYETSFFIMSRGYIGRGSKGVQKGDHLCIFSGGKMPYILREIEGTKHHKFLGECYVEGIMNGEAWPEISGNLREFVLE